ncbi:MAG TPA: immunoglobulin domain-containing protein [Candidatus Dormibacteraeota bacterium]|nr:immunoglobulin domain-containing protein [Candidatus Dormibacteraeota bacterium]
MLSSLAKPFVWMVGAFLVVQTASAQLAITEVMSSASTNLGSTVVTQASDFWELTNFGTNAVNLNDGYRWNDNAGGFVGADPNPFVGLSIGPGESILFFETNNPFMTTPEQFRTWWNLAPTQKVVVYVGNGLSSAGDGVRVWDGSGNLIDSVDFVAAERGRTFVYDPGTGNFGLLSSNGVGGAFKASTADDFGSPGTTTGPVPAQIFTQPSSLQVNPGDTATFTVVAGGVPRPKFQWYFKGDTIANATAATLSVVNVQSDQLGEYKVFVENVAGGLFSSTVTLGLNALPEPPAFVISPSNQNAFVGQTVTLVSLASGTPQPTYQWHRDSTLLAETGSTNILRNLTLADAGLYTVVASNPLGAATNQATVQVTTRPRLVITEIMAAQSTNGPYGGHNDWWELTNLGEFPVDLSGYRFDDGSATLLASVTFTNTPLLIAPGESIIFVEGMPAEAFRSWWGADNLLPTQQIITYRGAGLGLAAAGDSVNVWNSAATLDNDTAVSQVFSGASAGISLGYNADAQRFGDASRVGFDGAFVARENGDIGSPGYIRNPLNPRIINFNRTGSGWVLTWTAMPGRSYTVESASDLGGTTWSVLSTFPATDTFEVFTDPLSGDARRFYRVRLEP